MAIVALVIAIGFSAFKAGDSKAKPSTKNEVTLHFKGDVYDPQSVKDPANWAENNPADICLTGVQACNMTVLESDVTGTAPNRVLDGSQIVLDATGSISSGYAPTKIAGPGSTPTIRNKN